MKEPLVAGYPVALRLPQSRFRNPRDVIILIGGAALLAALLTSAAVAHGRLLGPGAPVPSPVRSGQPAKTLAGLVQVAVCAGPAAVVVAAGLHRRFRKPMPGQSGPPAAEIRAGIRDSPDSGWAASCHTR